MEVDMRFCGYMPGWHPNSRRNLRPRFTTVNSTGRPRGFPPHFYRELQRLRDTGIGKRRLARRFGVSAGLLQRVKQWSLAGTLVLLTAAAAHAQTATSANRLEWSQAAPDLATAQGYTPKHYDDASTTGTVSTGMTCAGTASPFTCSIPFPAFTPGAHTIALTVSAGTSESAKSPVFSFTFTVIPTAPASLHIAGLVTPPPPVPTTTTVTFNSLTATNTNLTGVYPAGILDWGTAGWYLSGPYGPFTSNSVSFTASAKSALVTILNGGWLTSLKAYNSDALATTVTLGCPPSPPVTASVAAGAVTTIQTGWTAPCAAVTVGTANGWNTNFDDLVVTSS